MAATEEQTEQMAYVALIVPCGCLVAASIDEPRHKRDTAKFVAAKIRDGFRVERVSVAAAKAMPGWEWPCEHMVAAADAARGPQSEALFDAGETE